MNTLKKKHCQCNKTQTPRPETVEKYRQAIEEYRTTNTSCRVICRKFGLSEEGFRGYLYRYHRNLMLARYNISCSLEEALNIKMNQLRGQLPATRIKYQNAIIASGSSEFIEFSISQISGMFGLNGSGLMRQLRTHYPEILEFREKERARLGIDDHLPRGMRSFAKEQYAKAVDLLRGNSYITVQEAADTCGVSYTGLEQHLLFYYKDLVKKRIRIREKAVRQQLKGKITGRGTLHVPTSVVSAKYAKSVQLFCTTPMSMAKIAAQAQVSKKAFYEYMHRWHMDLICERKGIPYKEGTPVDFSKVRKYNPATKAKYAEAIRRLQDSGLPTAKVATEFGLHPESFRSYLKEHEPKLYARQGMVKTEKGTMLRSSMAKYANAIEQYSTTTEPLNVIARRFGVNSCSLRDFIKRHFPDLKKQRNKLLEGEKGN